jgi:hypothetical protein
MPLKLIFVTYKIESFISIAKICYRSNESLNFFLPFFGFLKRRHLDSNLCFSIQSVAMLFMFK